MSASAVVLLADAEELGGVFICSFVAFLVPVIFGWLVARSTTVRMGRARRAAAMLADDLVLLLTAGDCARARQLAEAQGTPLAQGALRLLDADPARRGEVAADIVEDGKRWLWRKGETGAGCLLWGLGLLAALLVVVFDGMLIGFSGDNSATASNELLAWAAALPGGGMGLVAMLHLWGRVRGAREELCALHAAEIGKIRAAMEALPPA